jgi:hypothetical protein
MGTWSGVSPEQALGLERWPIMPTRCRSSNVRRTLIPTACDAWFNLGFMLSQLGRKAEALSADEHATSQVAFACLAYSN